MKMVSNYYSGLFKSSVALISRNQLENNEVLLNDAMHDILLHPYTKEEAVLAFIGMHPAKLPGPDGFPIMFIMNLGYCW